MVASWSGSCMTQPNTRLRREHRAQRRGPPSDQLYRTSNNEGHRVAVTLDTKLFIQGCVKTCLARTLRIVFSIAYHQQHLPVRLVSATTKSRWKFYAQVQCLSFHTAWVKTGSLALRRNVCLAPILLQKAKVAEVRIFGENLKREGIDDLYSTSRATEVAYEFSVTRRGP